MIEQSSFSCSKTKIFIAGARGMVGSAIVRKLKSQGYQNLLTPTSEELDLRDQKKVKQFFDQEKPEYVFLSAAKVGGIGAISEAKAEFIYDNISITLNVIEQAREHGVKKLLFIASSCIYPKVCPQPMQESAMLSGKLEPNVEPYALAKIAGIKLCETYSYQYNSNFISIVPSNLYGPGDRYELGKSNVLPALIRRFHEAKINNTPSVEIWGDGSPRREFMYVDDLADACIFLMKNYDSPEMINVGVGSDISILELAEKIQKIVGYTGELKFDASKPNGTLRKLVDSEKLNQMGFKTKVQLDEGIREVYKDFLKVYEVVNTSIGN